MSDQNIPTEQEPLKSIARRIRRQTLRMIHKARSAHIGSNFSMVELLTVLYTRVLRVDPASPHSPERDRFILSKGHACASLYAILADRGFFPVEWLDTFYENGSQLAGHITHSVPGIEVSTGSLGHGLPIAVGMALAAKQDDKSYRVWALLSDGECDEGSTWEAILFASHWALDNLVVLVDYNKIQSLGRVDEVMGLEPFADKWRTFGWKTLEVDGHDMPQLERAFARIPFEAGRPSCIVAHTIKGKGVSFMEDKLLWHYRSPQEQEYEAALAELDYGL